MAKQQRTLGVFIIQLALAIYFVVTGLCLFGIGGSISSDEINALTELFGKAAKVLDIIIGILLIACGVMFLIKAFGVDLGKLDDIVKYVTLILWIVITVIALIENIGDFSAGNNQWLHWFLVLAKNALIIGGVLTIKNGN
jgi:uncharacterized membrane protein YphA (DoxX/SURF4 family)